MQKTQNHIIDPECKLQNVEIVCDDKQRPYSCTLNFASVQNNSNKFYILQYLKQSSTPVKYHIFVRYGRIRETGMTSVKSFEEKEKHKANAYFQKQFFTKTGNQWNSITKYSDFTLKPNKYNLVDFEDLAIEQEETIGVEDDKTSNLPLPIKDFIAEISDKKMHMSTIATFDVDLNKLPLGKISSKQLEKANGILNALSECIKNAGDDEDISSNLIKYSNEFWMTVPYSCGRVSPPIIKTPEHVQKFAELLDIIKNTEIAGKITRRFNNIFDIYSHMDMQLSVVEDESERKMLCDQIYGTHAPTHQYGIKILETLRIQKDIADEHQTYFKSIPNHKLLMHGSRKANFMGILSTGLRLPLANQVSNGSVLGKGIYFADISTKSFNYCGVDGINDTGYLLLCEVALGENSDFRQSPSFDANLASHQKSRIALGKSFLPETSFTNHSTSDKYLDNVEISYGPIVARANSTSSFLYNEYVIFDTRQYQFKYLVKIQKTRQS